MIADLPPLPGAEDSGLVRLKALFAGAGLVDITTHVIDVVVEFGDFDAFWAAQTPSYAPTTQRIAVMDMRERQRFEDAVRRRLQTATDGTIRYPARANAVRGSAPY